MHPRIVIGTWFQPRNEISTKYLYYDIKTTYDVCVLGTYMYSMTTVRPSTWHRCAPRPTFGARVAACRTCLASPWLPHSAEKRYGATREATTHNAIIAIGRAVLCLPLEKREGASSVPFSCTWCWSYWRRGRNCNWCNRHRFNPRWYCRANITTANNSKAWQK